MDIGIVLVVVCGLSLLCLVSLGIFAFFTGRGLFAPILREFFGDGEIIDGEEEDSGGRRRKHKIGDIKAKAQALDFDEALQRHRRGQAPFDAQAAPPQRPRPSAPLGGKRGQAKGIAPKPKGRPFPPMKRRGGHALGGEETTRSGLRRGRDRDQDELFDFLDED